MKMTKENIVYLESNCWGGVCLGVRDFINSEKVVRVTYRDGHTRAGTGPAELTPEIVWYYEKKK